MVNPGGYIRKAFYSSLNGAINYDGNIIPVYENEDGATENEYSIHIKALLGNNRDTAQSFNGDYRINIEVVHNRMGTSTKQAYEIADVVCGVLLPNKNGLSLTGGLQMVGMRLENQNELIEGPGDGKNIVRIVMTFYFRIHQTTLV